MTEELKRKLVKEYGLNYSALSGKTVDAVLNYCMNADSRELIAEAKNEAEQIIERAKFHSLELKQIEEALELNIKAKGEEYKAIVQASEEYGSIKDEKAKDIIALYCALLAINKNNGVNGEDSVRNASFIVYAYCGGQARQIINELEG